MKRSILPNAFHRKSPENSSTEFWTTSLTKKSPALPMAKLPKPNNFTHRSWMQRALRLAEKGRFTTSPNPMVGACLVKNGRLIAEGFHRVYGGDHAEVEALKRAGARAKGASLYVTLEP